MLRSCDVVVNLRAVDAVLVLPRYRIEKREARVLEFNTPGTFTVRGDVIVESS